MYYFQAHKKDWSKILPSMKYPQDAYVLIWSMTDVNTMICSEKKGNKNKVKVRV